MCGPSSSSSGGQGNITRGGRGSLIAEKKKSPTEQAFSTGLSKFVGSMLGGAVGGPAGAVAGSKFLGDIAKGSTTREINLATGKSTAGPGAGPSGDAGEERTRLALVQDAAAKTVATEEKAAATAATTTKRKKAAAGTTKASTILAGRKIAEEKLKTKLGQ